MTDATCPDCDMATRELWHAFRAGCKGCAARMLSRGPVFFKARMSGRLTPEYLAALKALGLQHHEVKAAAAVDFGGALAKGATC